MSACDRCGKDLDSATSFLHAGRSLCEECYMDLLSPPKACDPWAVYTARGAVTKGQTAVTLLQEKTLTLLAEKGPMSRQALKALLEIDDRELRRELATLRHMERVKATKISGEVRYTLFER